MEEILIETEEKMQNAINNMELRFVNIRAGRANANILDGIVISYYDIDTPLKQLSNISIPEARQIVIKPFDKSLLGSIERAIYESNIGLTPNNNGEIIILNIPPLTEDTRREYVKQVKNIAEEARIALRNIRQDANSKIKKLDLSEDDIKNGNDEVQELINSYNKIVDDKLKVKEQELMQV